MAFPGISGHTDGVEIRVAVSDDAETVGRLTLDVYRGNGSVGPNTDHGYLKSLSDGASRIKHATVFVAEVDGELVGTITAARRGSPLSHVATADELEVRMLAVEASSRRHGVANGLVAACEQLARDDEKMAIILCTESWNSAAQSFYIQRGYQPVPDRDWTVNGTTLLAYEMRL